MRIRGLAGIARDGGGPRHQLLEVCNRSFVFFAAELMGLEHLFLGIGRGNRQRVSKAGAEAAPRLLVRILGNRRARPGRAVIRPRAVFLAPALPGRRRSNAPIVPDHPKAEAELGAEAKARDVAPLAVHGRGRSSGLGTLSFIGGFAWPRGLRGDRVETPSALLVCRPKRGSSSRNGPCGCSQATAHLKRGALHEDDDLGVEAEEAESMGITT